MEPTLNWFDRVIMFFAPKWGAERVRARVLARHFEAASFGRRTDGWSRRHTDANTAAAGSTLANLRAQARDLVRNNPWATRGLNRIARNTVGWGIKPSAAGRNADRIMDVWKRWGETTQCDAAGRLNFYGLQELVMRTVVESGEVLVRRRRRKLEDGLAVPLQLQILEPDYIDTGKDGVQGQAGGKIVQGVEFDAIGRRVAYWLFDEHPGSNSMGASPVSKRVPADGVLHIFSQSRPGQVRGTSWFAPVDVRLHEFDEFEDATLLKQKIAACMAVLVTDLDGGGGELGKAGTDGASGQPTDTLAPGMILNLPAGKDVTVANPPQASDHQSFSMAALRGIAAGLGVTYEDLTGDYSQVNFSSARMARLAHMADVHSWRWNMLVPQFFAPVWAWMLETLAIAGEDIEVESAEWTPPAMPMIDPANEGLALSRLVRTGAMTLDEMVREQGYDPKKFWKEYAAGLQTLDSLGIILDSDARKTSGGGQLQAAAKPEAGDKASSSDAGEGNTEEATKATERAVAAERAAAVADGRTEAVQRALAAALERAAIAEQMARENGERAARAEAQAECDRDRLERARDDWDAREKDYQRHLDSLDEAHRARLQEVEERWTAQHEARLAAALAQAQQAQAEQTARHTRELAERDIDLAKATVRAEYAERALTAAGLVAGA